MKKFRIAAFALIALVLSGCDLFGGTDTEIEPTFAEYLATLPREAPVDSAAIMSAVTSSTVFADASILEVQTTYDSTAKGRSRSIEGIDGIDPDTTTYTAELAVFEYVMQEFAIRCAAYDLATQESITGGIPIWFYSFSDFFDWYAPVYGETYYYYIRYTAGVPFQSSPSGVSIYMENAEKASINDTRGHAAGRVFVPAIVSWDWDYSADAEAVRHFGEEQVINLLVYASIDATETSGFRQGLFIAVDTMKLMAYKYEQ